MMRLRISTVWVRMGTCQSPSHKGVRTPLHDLAGEQPLPNKCEEMVDSKHNNQRETNSGRPDHVCDIGLRGLREAYKVRV